MIELPAGSAHASGNVAIRINDAAANIVQNSISHVTRASLGSREDL